MTDLPCDFVATSSPEAQKPLSALPGTASFITIGPPEFAVHLPTVQREMAAAFSSPSVTCCIAPIGEPGRRLWQNVGPELARLVCTVRPEAIIVFRRSAVASLSQPRNWSDFLLSINPQQLHVLPAACFLSELPHGVDPRWPLLIPRSKALSARWSKAFALYGDSTQAIALRAGLSQILGDMEGSHELAQSIEGHGQPRNGDYWHAILHRREPDYHNAKYWFRNVGRHPLFDDLNTFARQVLRESANSSVQIWRKKLDSDAWDPLVFVDLCRDAAAQTGSPLDLAARQIQWMEMLLLLAHCKAA